MTKIAVGCVGEAQTSQIWYVVIGFLNLKISAKHFDHFYDINQNIKEILQRGNQSDT